MHLEFLKFFFMSCFFVRNEFSSRFHRINIIIMHLLFPYIKHINHIDWSEMYSNIPKKKKNDSNSFHKRIFPENKGYCGHYHFFRLLVIRNILQKCIMWLWKIFIRMKSFVFNNGNNNKIIVHIWFVRSHMQNYYSL